MTGILKATSKKAGFFVENFKFIRCVIPSSFMRRAACETACAEVTQMPDYDKYNELVHYIIASCGNLPNFGKTLLWKMLYFSDFDYYELNYKSITGEMYRKIAMGPAPCHIDAVIKELSQEKKITRVTGAKFFGKSLEKYVAKEDPTFDHLTVEEKNLVDNVIKRFSSMTATQASEYSHLDTPWRVTEDKEIIDYEFVFHRSPITSVRAD